MLIPRILYYPHYQPPAAWLRSMLLLTDGIQRIVPREVDPDDSDDIKALLEAIPGSLVRRELSTSDIVFDELTFERLRKAFQLIKKDVEKLNAGGVCMQIHDSGGFSIEGHTFLHKDKVAARMKELLSETGLLDPVAEGISESLCSSYLPVPTEASNLILPASPTASRLVKGSIR